MTRIRPKILVLGVHSGHKKDHTITVAGSLNGA